MKVSEKPDDSGVSPEFKWVAPCLYKRDNGRYYERVYKDGKESMHSLKTTNEKVATGRMGGKLDNPQAPVQVLVGKALDKYAADGYPHRKRKTRPEDTHKAEARSVVTLKEFWQEKSIDGITIAECDEYHDWRVERVTKGKGDRTVDLELNTLHNACVWAARSELIPAVPLAGAWPKYQAEKDVHHCREFAPNNAEELHATAGMLFEHWSSAVLGWQALIEAYTGLRTAEALQLPNLARIRGLFLITITAGSGPKSWLVDDVRGTKPVQSLVIFPPSAQLATGGSMQLTVEGRSSANEPVMVNPTFTVVQGAGSVTPRAPSAAMSTTFTAGSSLGTSVVSAVLADPSVSSLSLTARVDVVSTPAVGSFWLYSDVNPLSVTPDVDSQILVFQGGTVAPLLIVEMSGDACEGTNSLQATVNHAATNAFSGWTYQWGLTNSADADTHDMSLFHDATLTFCFKAPADLVGKVHVGIRSGNVPAGNELSSLVLTNAALFDGNWHTVGVPVKALAGATPWADLARIKNFFTISVLGTTSGAESFSVDNLRWEQQQPFSFTQVLQKSNGDFYLVLSGSPGTSFVLSRSQDLRTWVDVLTNVLGITGFQFTETNNARNASFFYRAKSK